MTKKIIFLSYRRGDSPGYVKSLEKELEDYYGEDSVFRDVEDIAGGKIWKEVIEENLSNAAVLLLIIGPRWDSIWLDRIDDKVNYVEYELNYAYQLKVPIIPITLDGSSIADEIDLKSVSWLRENQQYDMSDKQGRWENDFQGLLKLLENIKGISPAKSENDQDSHQPFKKKRSVLKVAVSIVVALIIGLFLLDRLVPEIETIDTQENVAVFPPGFDCKKATTQIERIICENSDISNVDGQLGFVYEELTRVLSNKEFEKLKSNQRSWIKDRDSEIRSVCVESGRLNSKCVVKIYQERINTLKRILANLPKDNSKEKLTVNDVTTYRNLGGTWQGKDNTLYIVKQLENGRFEINSPGYG